MLLTKRPGVIRRSMRFQVTALGTAASTFFETNTRPAPVAAQAVLVSDTARSIAETELPARVPRAVEVKAGAAIGTQSPHTAAKSPVHLLQCCRNSASVMVPMPQVFVRQTLPVPTNIVFDTFGSLMIGT